MEIKNIKEKMLMFLIFVVALVFATNAGDVIFKGGNMNITGNLTLTNSNDVLLYGGIAVDDDSSPGTIADGDIRTYDGLLLVCDGDNCDNDIADTDGELYIEKDLEVDNGLCVEGATAYPCDSLSDGNVEIKDGSVCIGEDGCQAPGGQGSLSVDKSIYVYDDSYLYDILSLSTTSLPFAYFSGTQAGDGNSYKALELKRDNANAVDNDGLGITFKLRNDVPEYLDTAAIYGRITDVSDGTEDGSLEFHTIANGGALTNRMTINDIVRINDVMKINPRAAAPANPELGWMYVDSDSNEICFYNGAAWTGLRVGGACA